MKPALSLRGITLSGVPMTSVQDHVNMSHTIRVPLTYTAAGTTVNVIRYNLHIIQTVTAVDPKNKKEINRSDDTSIATASLVNAARSLSITSMIITDDRAISFPHG